MSLLRRAGFRWGLPVFRRIELLRKWEGHGAIAPDDVEPEPYKLLNCALAGVGGDSCTFFDDMSLRVVELAEGITYCELVLK